VRRSRSKISNIRQVSDERVAKAAGRSGSLFAVPHLDREAAQLTVVIVGGGVIGCAAAVALARAGAAVTLIERDRIGSGASHAAAGMLAPLSESDEEGPLAGC